MGRAVILLDQHQGDSEQSGCTSTLYGSYLMVFTANSFNSQQKNKVLDKAHCLGSGTSAAFRSLHYLWYIDVVLGLVPWEG